jgi:hypothetical protein
MDLQKLNIILYVSLENAVVAGDKLKQSVHVCYGEAVYYKLQKAREERM